MSIFVKTFIRLQRIGVQIRSCFNVLTDKRLKFRLAASIDYFGSDLSAALQDGSNNRFTSGAASGNLPLTIRFVHVPRLAADESLVYFYFAAKLPAEAFILHRQSDSMQHEPGGFLSDAKRPVKFPRRDTVAIAGNHPHGGKPLFQAKRRVFEDGPKLDRELSLWMASLALEHPARLDEADILRSACGADYTVRPTTVLEVVQAVVGVGKVLNSFEKSAGLVHHGSSIRQVA